MGRSLCWCWPTDTVGFIGYCSGSCVTNTCSDYESRWGLPHRVVLNCLRNMCTGEWIRRLFPKCLHHNVPVLPQLKTWFISSRNVAHRRNLANICLMRIGKRKKCLPLALWKEFKNFSFFRRNDQNRTMFIQSSFGKRLRKIEKPFPIVLHCTTTIVTFLCVLPRFSATNFYHTVAITLWMFWPAVFRVIV